MDYEWKYYLEDLKKVISEQEQAAGRTIWDTLSGSLSEEITERMKKDFIWQLRKYRESEGVSRQALHQLMEIHTQLCRDMPSDDLLKRRHNAMVYRYMVDTVAGNRAVAKKSGVSKATVYLDLNEMNNELMIICVGLPYLLQGKPTYVPEVVRLTIKHYSILSKMQQADKCLCLFPVKMRNYVKGAREVTGQFMSLFERSISIYTDFCKQKGISNINERRLEVLKQSIRGNQNVAQEVAAQYRCSSSLVYSDMKENQERLIHLTYMLIGGGNERDV